MIYTPTPTNDLLIGVHHMVSPDVLSDVVLGFYMERTRIQEGDILNHLSME